MKERKQVSRLTIPEYLVFYPKIAALLHQQVDGTWRWRRYEDGSKRTSESVARELGPPLTKNIVSHARAGLGMSNKNKSPPAVLTAADPIPDRVALIEGWLDKNWNNWRAAAV